MRASLSEQLSEHLGVAASPTPASSAKEVCAENQVIARTILWKAEPGEEPVLVTVTPQGAATLIKSDMVGEPYLSLLNGVKGGRVWFYLYGKDRPVESLRGKRAVAQVEEIVLRAFANGRQDVYANLRVVPNGIATHQLAAHAVAADFHRTEYTLFHQCVPDTDGIVHLRKIAPRSVRVS